MIHVIEETPYPCTSDDGTKYTIVYIINEDSKEYAEYHISEYDEIDFEEILLILDVVKASYYKTVYKNTSYEEQKRCSNHIRSLLIGYKDIESGIIVKENE